jgi:hypothetical protein
MNRQDPGVAARLIAALGSLRLTVTLLGASIFLVFAGTLAQVDRGIWSVMEQYFRCWIAWIDLRIFFNQDKDVTASLPFPGGWLIGTVLLVNLLISHSARIHLQARGGRRIGGFAVLAAGALLTWLVISKVFDADSSARKLAPFWRVTLQLLEGGGAAVVLFAGCRMLFARKAGIVLLHGGIVLMMLSELTTALVAEEGRMTLYEGQRVNYATVIQKVELAVVDPSSPDHDDVVVVPGRLLKGSSPVRSPELPFEVEVVKGKFMKNADLRALKPGETNVATAGEERSFVAEERPEATGDQVDYPACYAIFRSKAGQPIGTYMLSVLLDFEHKRQTIAVDGKSYEVSLRFKRVYKPYSVYLYDFQAVRHVGRGKPKDFSSYVRVEDAERGATRDVRIWMNNPLRYRGDTLYQSGWDEENESYTVLQVVENRGWMVPYVGCMIVAVGLLGQFLLHLSGFLRKRREAAA